MENQSELSEKLENICNVFNITQVLDLKINNKYIQKYYLVNRIPYSLFHSSTDLIHMAISRDGLYKEDDLFEPARIVGNYINKSAGRSVLELATGRGANSVYLSRKFSATKFYGIDISKGQLEYAFKKAKIVHNYYPDFGDYHDLSRFKNETFDIVFVVEALCYSTDKNKVLAEAYRVLKKDGVFIIFDGYSNKNLNQLLHEERIALQLAGKGMAMEKFESYRSFIRKAKKEKFKIDFEENVSQFVLPNMERFEKKAASFFKRPKTAKILSRILPKEFTYNIISGYLSTTLMRQNICNYMITVLKKEKR
ncbi:class I SAM-dependent methyltransferase [archaeon]|nr:class I SAM-dependent methyltransferase [Nanoarchaeota archaeon]MBU4451800.1 class I SAM-dependent methyltransferase [Nanoarchaeota archaeon]MCG2723471.1 class I SAM-dependent methyltransferase [archaeon]